MTLGGTTLLVLHTEGLVDGDLLGRVGIFVLLLGRHDGGIRRVWLDRLCGNAPNEGV